MLPLTCFPLTGSQVGQCLGPDPKQPLLVKVLPPALLRPLLQSRLFPLSGTESGSPSFLSSLPLEKKLREKKKKKKHQLPREGQQTVWGGEDRGGEGSQIPVRAGQGVTERRRGEGSGRSCPLPPLPTVQGASTQPRGQVCVGSGLMGRRQEQEKQIVKT